MVLLPILAGLLASQEVVEPGGDTVKVASCNALAASVASAEAARELTTALQSRGGVIRWETDGSQRVVRAWIQDRPSQLLKGNPAVEWHVAVRDGIVGWNAAQPDVRVVITRDSAEADVRMIWASTLTAARNDPGAGTLLNMTAGQTTLRFDDRGRIASATVLLAARVQWQWYSPTDARATARHEFGHVLGLAHHSSATSVMAPLIQTDRIGEQDREVIRGLYRLEMGSRCT